MLLSSEDGARVELWPVRYEFDDPGTVEGWDENWLVIHGGIRTAGGEEWTFDDPCLMVGEAHELGAWLRAAADGDAPEGLLAFIEPNLAFSIARGGDPVVLRVHLALESLAVEPPRGGLYAYSVPLTVRRRDLLTAARTWHEALASFPAR